MNEFEIRKLSVHSLSDIKVFLHYQNPFDVIFFQSNNENLLKETCGSYDLDNNLIALLGLGNESHYVLWKDEQSLKPLASLVRERYLITKISGQASVITPWLSQFQASEIVFAQEGYACILTKDRFHHFASPTKSFPIINMMSFDDEICYIGGFHAKTTAIQTEALYIRDANIAQMLKEYWLTLWHEAIPLNEGKIINWEELERIGIKLGMSKDEFDEMVSNAKERVQREKRRLKH